MDDSLGLRKALAAYVNRQWKKLWQIADALLPVLLRTGQYAPAKALLRWCYQAARDSRDTGKRQQYAEVLAWLLQTTRDLIELMQLCSENATLWGRDGNRSQEARWLQKAAVAAKWQGRLQEADLYLSRSLDIRRQDGDECGEARALWLRASLAEGEGDLDCAIERLERSCQMHQLLGMPHIETECACQDLDRLIAKRDDRKRRKTHPDTTEDI
jgi:tetratricopeptide (TPR) repeat protein